MPSSVVHIGTRDSLLAQWQSNKVASLLNDYGNDTKLVLIKSEGDINLVTPLYEMGVQGIFTKTLDAALLDKRIDVAVHSYKDVPTKLAEGLKIASVIKRANPLDLLVCRNSETYAELKQIDSTQNNIALKIATSSSRRKAQWLNRYPNSVLENLRGNVNSRLRKLQESDWQGAIFAAAGLERLGIEDLLTISLDWMLPAPAQGAIVVVCREDDVKMLEACSKFDDEATRICTSVEKDFLRVLMGGCSTPIGAYAEMKNNQIIFRGNILSPDGRLKQNIELKANSAEFSELGKRAATEILSSGGKDILKTFNEKYAANE